jgi:hypothetical protein
MSNVIRDDHPAPCSHCGVAVRAIVRDAEHDTPREREAARLLLRATLERAGLQVRVVATDGPVSIGIGQMPEPHMGEVEPA